MRDPYEFLNKYICISVNHKNAPTKIIEAVYFNNYDNDVNELKRSSGSREIILLQTCNRVEVYMYTDKPEYSAKAVKNVFTNKILNRYRNINKDYVENIITSYRGINVVKHIYRVASGLESMAIGEYEILGQVKDSYLKSLEYGVINEYLKILFEKALNVGKRVRLQTGVSRNPVSLPRASVKLAKEIVGDLSKIKIIILGAGNVAESIIKSLKEYDVNNVIILNRTYEKAVKLAKKYGFKYDHISYLNKHIRESDLVFVATSSPNPIIKKEMLEDLSSRKLIIDLSNPRNVEEDITNFGNIILKTLDDLKIITESNKIKRINEINKAEEIIEEEVEKFKIELWKLVGRSILKRIFIDAEEIRKKELEKAIKILDIDDEDYKILDVMTKSIVNKVLGPFVNKVYEAVYNGDISFLENVSKIILGGDKDV